MLCRSGDIVEASIRTRSYARPLKGCMTHGPAWTSGPIFDWGENADIEAMERLAAAILNALFDGMAVPLSYHKQFAEWFLPDIDRKGGKIRDEEVTCWINGYVAGLTDAAQGTLPADPEVSE